VADLPGQSLRAELFAEQEIDLQCGHGSQSVSDNDAWRTGDIQDMKTKLFKVGAGKGKHVAINLMNLQRRTFLQTIQPRVAGPAATSTPSPNTLQQPWSLQSTHVLVQFQMPKNRVPSMCPRLSLMTRVSSVPAAQSDTYHVQSRALCRASQICCFADQLAVQNRL
jgi:hypothetical protein